MSKKILIMGTGGSGTTFLWDVFKELGYDTGPLPEFLKWERTRGKMKAKEHIDFPQVIKHTGGFCHRLNHHVDFHKWEVEHIFFALRKFDSIVSSLTRWYKHKRENAEEDMRKEVPYAIGMGLLNIIEKDHPYTIVMFPQSALDPEYCYERLNPVLEDMEFDKFHEGWKRASKPSLITR